MKPFLFTALFCLFGFLVAVQYNTVHTPQEVRDTRETWEIRQALAEEREQHSAYLERIEQQTALLTQYKRATTDETTQVLMETVTQLEQLAGLTPYNGPGITVHITPAEEAVALGLEASHIPVPTLQRFVNDMYRYGARSIDIAGERLIAISAIRTIGDVTTVNSRAIQKPPLTIQIATTTLEEAETLRQRLVVSTAVESLYIDNLTVQIDAPSQNTTLAPYVGDQN